MRSGHVLIGALLAAQVATPADAQLGGLGGLLGRRSSPPPEQGQRDTGCADKPHRNTIGRQILGNMLGEATSRVTSQMGVVGRWVPSASVAGILSDAIACKLDPGEQKQAADATIAATRQEKVGASATWASSTRPGVTGTSTVVSKSAAAGGGTCMTVSDVIIVDGEETTVSKRMCRVPPATGYTIAQA